MKKINKYAYLFIAPTVIVFLIFNIYPILLTFYFSLTNYRGFGGIENADFVGVSNYGRLINDKYYWESIKNTLFIWIGGFAFQLALALGLALIFSDLQLKIKGLYVFRAIYYLPNIVTLASVALLFSMLLDWNYGAINDILLKFGIISQPIQWLNQPVFAQASVSAINAWMWFGQTFIVILAGITGISRDSVEAAYVDGANWWQRFWYVTLPQLKPILLFVMVTSLIGGMQMFDLPRLLTDGLGSPRGSLNTVVLFLYNQAFEYNNFGYASAIAYGLFIITIILSFFIYRSLYGNLLKRKG